MAASEPAPYTGPQPTQIGRHDVVSLVGQGGMARVFLAIQRGAFDAHKLVVIKQLLPEFAHDEAFLAMFVDEARLALRFNHPNVVHTYEVIAESPDYCLIMEYLEGQTLAQLQRRVGRERLDVDDQIWILTQVLAGLGYAHSLADFDGTPLGVVHRDVTPTNIFITSAGEVKLLDFGIAKANGAVSLTRQGLVKGKVGYAAPEQCLAQPSDARSDIFSVGMMLWEAIAKRKRTLGESQLATLRARVEGAEPAIEEVVPDVAPELAEACRRALSHDPAGRYQTAPEFQTVLETYLASRPPRKASENLGALMRDAFAKELAGMRQAVEAHTSSSNRTQTRVTPRAGFQTSSTSPLTRSSPVERAPADDPVDFRRPPLHRRLLAAAGLAAVAGVFAFVATRGTTPAPAPSAASAAPPVAALPAPVPSPSGAAVEASATGHEPEARAPRAERDPAPRSKAAERNGGTKSAPATTAAEARASAAPPASAPEPRARATAASTSEAIAPGMDLKKSAPPRSTRGIDEQDPYR